MSIRWKMAAIGIAAALLYIAANLVLQRTVIGPSFEELERAQAASELERVRQAFDAELERIRSLSRTWARGNPADIPITPETCADRQLNVMAWVDTGGRSSRYATLDLQTNKPLVLPDIPDGSWPAGHPLATGAAVSGLFPTSSGALMVSASPMAATDRGKKSGTLIVGRLVTPAFIEELGAQTHADSYFAVRETAANPTAEYFYAPDRNGNLCVATVLNDLFGHPSFELGARVPRTIMRRGQLAQRLGAMGGVAVGLLALVFLMVVLRRAVTDPLRRLLQHVRGIRESGSLAFVDVGLRKDEFGALADEFNQMVARLESDAVQHERMQEQLEENRRLAELGELGASMAHEIRNPLAGISGALQVLRDGLGPTDERRAIIEETLAQIMRVENTVRRLLDYSKPWHPSKQAGDIRAFVKKCCEDLARRSLPDGCVCEVEDGKPLGALFDPELLEQVLENAICNAVQAMPGGGRIRVTFSEAAREVSVRVSDEGPGLAEEALPKVFDPFFTTKARGAGLGLSVCRRIIEAHGGHIKMANTGNGAEVVFSLPREPGAPSGAGEKSWGAAGK